MLAYVSIYRNRVTSSYVIQPLGKDPDGFIIDNGAPEILSEAEFDSRILNAIEKAIEKFKPESKESDGKEWRDKDYDEFLRTHDHVTVMRTEKGFYEVVPSKRMKGGYRSQEDSRVVVKPQRLSVDLLPVVRAAFGKCQ